jgi:putative polyhydroxyalkanoate system protein
MIRFERSGVNGALRVSGSVLEVDIQLGLMMKPLKPMIEAEVQKGLARAIEKAAGQA